MEPLTNFFVSYVVTLMVTFFGVISGTIIGFIAPEELGPGEGYLKVLQNVLSALVIAVVLYLVGVPLVFVLTLTVAVTVMQILYSDKDISVMIYIMLAIIFALSAGRVTSFIAAASGIFLYGLPTGSLFVLKNSKKKRSVVVADAFLVYGIFIVIALIVNLLRIGNLF